MVARVETSHALDGSVFSIWQFVLFGLIFGVLGGLVVFKTFAATNPVKTFVSTRQGIGTVEFSASVEESFPTSDLAVTNNCYNGSSKLANSKTTPLTHWLENADGGHIGYASFNNTPSKLHCQAYVHKSGDTKSLADFSYVSQ